MTRFGGPVFPARYPAGPAGLISAEQELQRLTVLRDAYAHQPNITAIWQGYIDQKAGDVACQQAVVAKLKDAAEAQPAA